ncbi:HAD family hydrolase [Rhodobacter sp. NTK016B]|uniref:HAD family hydrolase n=1 Tax=Rhodobacter sp. NTK016B TaxID=2759676 RepID=UPI001A8FC7B3|nr:HAD family hydrolase [Rhodobacter sp. NTK016B]MBN8293204.1 HAD family hydrolase [Rhodobacter sp. NTK016B]
MQLTTIGLDADDTLWHNERFFTLTQQRFAELLADYAETEHLAERLLDAEQRNLGQYGFGIKGFVLSMIETAIEVTEGRVPGSVIGQIIAAGQDMLAHPIELLPGVQETIERLADRHRLVLITKGDLLDQERKLAQSGLGDLFDAVEIVSHKTPEIYARIFDNHGDGAAQALMAGNSMKSDVVPPIEAGAFGVFVPHGREWALERAEAPEAHPRFRRISTLSELPDLLDHLR